MKKILLAVLSAMLLPCGLQAQDTETHVTVHAGETALETLFTEEQKQSVTHLTVTGTLLEEDYAFLRSGLLEQLDTLDLREAEIDTIPAGALGEMNLYLILPKVIKCIGDYAFTGECEVTGNFPYISEYKNDPIYKPLMLASKDHPFLVNVEELCHFAVYSKNGDILYYLKPKDEFAYWGGELEVRSGTRIIAPTAIRNEVVPMESNNLILPESMDSIGDYAFDVSPDVMVRDTKKNLYPSGGGRHIGGIVCEAKNPPKLGILGDSFWVSFSYLYVPETSLEAYKAAPGWKLARKIDTIENLLKNGSQIPSVRGEKNTPVSITSADESYILNFSKKPLLMELFSTDGSLLSSQKLSSMEVTLPKTKLKKALTIVCVRFADGTNETFKLIP